MNLSTHQQKTEFWLQSLYFVKFSDAWNYSEMCYAKQFHINFFVTSPICDAVTIMMHHQLLGLMNGCPKPAPPTFDNKLDFGAGTELLLATRI